MRVSLTLGTVSCYYTQGDSHGEEMPSGALALADTYGYQDSQGIEPPRTDAVHMARYVLSFLTTQTWSGCLS